MNGQEMTIPTVYSNYKDVNGVKLPHTLSQSMMGQDGNQYQVLYL